MSKMLLPLLFISFFGSMAQDTLEITYPGTSQRWIKRYESGKKLNETIFHTNEQVWMQVHYIKGQEKWNWYHENGSPYFEATIENDSLQGLYQIGYGNGQIAEKIMFLDNLENGRAEFYYRNGQLAMRGTYKNGKMQDDWLFLSPEGEPANGLWQWAFAADTNEWRMNGRVINGKMTGNWIYRGVAGLGTKDEIKFSKTIE